MSQRTQRKAALQASQQLAWDATHDDPPVSFADIRQTPDAEGQRMRSGAKERKTTALEEWRMRRIRRQFVDLERTNAHDLPATAFPLPTRDEPMDTLPPDATTTVPQSMARLHRRKNDKRKRGMMTANVKTLVQYRKTLREYLNELHPLQQLHQGIPAQRVLIPMGNTHAKGAERGRVLLVAGRHIGRSLLEKADVVLGRREWSALRDALGVRGEGLR